MHPDTQDMAISGDGKAPIENLLMNACARDIFDSWGGMLGLAWAMRKLTLE